MKTIHFLAGLPRSGTTLLANIFCQNPRFHSTHTSGCLSVLHGIRNHWSTLVEHKAHPVPDKLDNVLRATLQSYYQEIDRPVIIDKSRGWLAYIEFVEKILNRKSKIIVPIRPVPEILASFENLHRETSKIKQSPGEVDNYFQFQTVKGRCDYWMRNDQVVGIALNRLKDAVSRGLKDRLFFVDFNGLTARPEQTLRSIYHFLEEDYFDHNFDYVEQVTTEDDEVHGFVNLHKIRNKVEPIKNRAIETLGQELVNSFADMI